MIYVKVLIVNYQYWNDFMKIVNKNVLLYAIFFVGSYLYIFANGNKERRSFNRNSHADVSIE